MSKRRASNAMHMRLVSTLFAAAVLSGCQSSGSQSQQAREAAYANVQKGKALFEEKCRTVAGERIYRTVSGIEGIVLLKVRPRVGEREWADPMWAGAAFALEATSEEYVSTFLGYEHSSSQKGEPVSAKHRGYISSDYQPQNPSNLEGYRFVDVVNEREQKRYRFTGSEQVVGKKDVNAPAVRMALAANPNYDLNIYRYTLQRSVTSAPMPRYGVTFEDQIVPEHRALGVASSSVRVLDLSTNEVLGELTRYAWSPGGPSVANPSPWLTAHRCPAYTVGAEAVTRKFVDQILVPLGRK